MLDHVARYAPYADIYFYMHWAQTSSTVLNAALSNYNKATAFMPQVLDFAGTESGVQFKDIIPVGLSIQNARTTYLALLRYNTTAYADGNLNLITDAQIGLQRDGGHVSFNIGRYIAALTFAETIIPVGMRVEGYVLPDIRITESVGQLPKEYSELAQKSVFAAVNGWKNGSLAVANIEGYTQDPTVAAIASEEAAEVFGLSVLERNINASRSNTTRFAALSRVESRRHSKRMGEHFILLFTVKHEAGALAKAVDIIGRYGFNMRTLRSRPMKELLWQYYFYVEAEGDVYTEAGEWMMRELGLFCDRLKLVGTYFNEKNNA